MESQISLQSRLKVTTANGYVDGRTAKYRAAHIHVRTGRVCHAFDVTTAYRRLEEIIGYEQTKLIDPFHRYFEKEILPQNAELAVSPLYWEVVSSPFVLSLLKKDLTKIVHRQDRWSTNMTYHFRVSLGLPSFLIESQVTFLRNLEKCLAFDLEHGTRTVNVGVFLNYLETNQVKSNLELACIFFHEVQRWVLQGKSQVESLDLVESLPQFFEVVEIIVMEQNTITLRNLANIWLAFMEEIHESGKRIKRTPRFEQFFIHFLYRKHRKLSLALRLENRIRPQFKHIPAKRPLIWLPYFLMQHFHVDHTCLETEFIGHILHGNTVKSFPAFAEIKLSNRAAHELLTVKENNLTLWQALCLARAKAVCSPQIWDTYEARNFFGSFRNGLPTYFYGAYFEEIFIFFRKK